jgi:metal-sulfur cluster biosynthetic enzyme
MSDPSRRVGLPLSGERPQPPENPAPAPDPDASLEEKVIAVLRTVYDPEIPVDVYELGLVYNLDVSPEGVVHIRMTLTTPACPAGPQIIEQARREVGALKDVYGGLEEVNINLVWTPFWNPSMMSEEAREELGFF